MKFKQLYLFVFGLALILLLSACVHPPAIPSDSDNAAESPVEVTGRGAGDQLKILYWQAASSMNLFLVSGLKEVEAASLVLEPLARYNEKGEMVPWLAQEIPTLENGGISEDLTTITWKLKDGILWSDGTPFTAEDVVFTAEYCMDKDMGCVISSHFMHVEQVKALDPLTVQITFIQPKPYPYGPFVSQLVPILQKAQFSECMGVKAQGCTDQNFAPIGTGPYKVADFKPSDVILYTINENYRELDKPFFKKVVIKGGGSAAAAARSVLKNGEADYAWNLQVEPQVLQEMESAKKGKIIAAFGTGVERLFVNFTNPDPALGELRSEWSVENSNPHPFLTDKAVRQALSLAIDRNLIAKRLYGEGGLAVCNVVPAPDFYVSPNNNECLTQNIEKAKAVLDEAGWKLGADGVREKNGVRLSLLFQTSTNSVRQDTQALIKQWWSEIGVETELRNVKASVFFGGDLSSPDTISKFYADIQMVNHSFIGADPEPHLSEWTCSNIPNSANQWSSRNLSRWCNKSYDELLVKLTKIADTKQRIEIAIQLNDIIIQNYVTIPLIHRGRVSAHSNTLKGVRMNAWDSEFWNIADWTRKQ